MITYVRSLGKPGATMRVLHPAPNVLAFYDGRIPGVRLHALGENWLDDSAYTLGIASYAIVDGTQALVYDAHISPQHGGIIRESLARMGVTAITVVLSHWHADHIAGLTAFDDCAIIANELTCRKLRENQDKLNKSLPPIPVVVMPNRVFSGSLEMMVGSVPVQLFQVDVHSEDGTVLYLPQRRLLLAGDTLEDPVTYVAEPDRLEAHMAGLRQLAAMPIEAILPNHGCPTVIGAGGYGTGLIGGTISYIEKLLKMRSEKDAPDSLARFAAAEFAAGAIRYYPEYEWVHQHNVRAVLAARRARASPQR